MSKSVESPQPFWTSALFAKTLPYSKLKERIGNQEGAAYSYVVKSVRMDSKGQHFEQHGSGPNFQGGRLTLCTCKYQMRTNLGRSDWKHTWIAGFTSRCLHEKRHWLFYLTRVKAAFESHAELWNSFPTVVREAKAAHKHFLGDLFAPRGKIADDGQFNPRRYYPPKHHSHRRNSCDIGWHNDIDYWCADRYGRPSLLVGDPQLTFLWEEPRIFFDEDHCRNFKKWASISELLSHLKCEGP